MKSRNLSTDMLILRSIWIEPEGIRAMPDKRGLEIFQPDFSLDQNCQKWQKIFAGQEKMTTFAFGKVIHDQLPLNSPRA